jgi:hypothetical protein
LLEADGAEEGPYLHKPYTHDEAQVREALEAARSKEHEIGPRLGTNNQGGDRC